MTQRIVWNEVSYHGYGAIEHIPEEVTNRRWKHALVCSDPALEAAGLVEKVTELLEREGHAYTCFLDIKPNPTIENVQAGVEAYRDAGADYLIAIGGGSVMDCAKAIGIIINNPDFADVRSLEGVAPTTERMAPLIAVATTAGTAAEVTINYVITDVERNRKFVCVDPKDIPTIAVVDPGMMLSMPAGLTAATGMDALTHAIEGFITLGAWEMTDMVHLRSIELIAQNLRASVAGDRDAREKMALASYMAGMGFSNVGLGIDHSMAHPLGAFYDTPHGVANAIILPVVMAYNAPYTGDKYRAIARAMGVEGVDEMDEATYRQAACEAVAQLGADVGIPANLEGILRLEDLDFIAESALNDVCTGGNPRPTTLEEIKDLYRQML